MLTPEQIAVVGSLAMVLTFALRILFTYGGVQLNRLTVNILLFVVSGGLAIWWTAPQLPPFTGDPAAWLTAFFQLAIGVVGFATLIYNLLYDKVVVPLQARFSKAS